MDDNDNDAEVVDETVRQIQSGYFSIHEEVTNLFVYGLNNIEHIRRLRDRVVGFLGQAGRVSASLTRRHSLTKAVSRSIFRGGVGRFGDEHIQNGAVSRPNEERCSV